MSLNCRLWNRFSPDLFVRLFQVRFWTLIPAFLSVFYETAPWPQKTTEGSPDCWANHWYKPPHSPRTVLIQSEQKGWQNHSGPLTPSTLPLWTVTVWSTLQSSEHQNDQTQEQFLPSGNPSHEHLTIIVEHTTLLYTYTLIYLTHILSLHFEFAHNIPVHTKLSIVIHLYIQLSICIVLFLIYLFYFLFFYYLCFLFCHCHSVALQKLLSRKQIPHMCKHTWQ